MYSKENNKNQTCNKHNVLFKRNQKILVRQQRIVELRNIRWMWTFLVKRVQVVSALIGDKSRVIKILKNKYARKTFGRRLVQNGLAAYSDIHLFVYLSIYERYTSRTQIIAFSGVSERGEILDVIIRRPLLRRFRKVIEHIFGDNTGK